MEYKTSWHDKYLEWICGFANAQGAAMYFGVNDDHEVVGLENVDRLMEDIPKDYNGSLCSTGFYVIRSSFFNPETLLVLFKSKPIQMLMKKGCSGTILTAISKNELAKIPLPLITERIQEKIAQYVQDSFKLRRESKFLLDIAKL